MSATRPARLDGSAGPAGISPAPIRSEHGLTPVEIGALHELSCRGIVPSDKRRAGRLGGGGGRQRAGGLPAASHHPVMARMGHARRVPPAKLIVPECSRGSEATALPRQKGVLARPRGDGATAFRRRATRLYDGKTDRWPGMPASMVLGSGGRLPYHANCRRQVHRAFFDTNWPTARATGQTLSGLCDWWRSARLALMEFGAGALA